MILKPGKRYYWYSLKCGNIYYGRRKSGLFTGKFDENNHNALLMTHNGETWSIPIHDLRLEKEN